MANCRNPFDQFATVEHYRDKWMSRVAVISPYAEQVKVCSKQIKALFGVS